MSEVIQWIWRAPPAGQAVNGAVGQGEEGSQTGGQTDDHGPAGKS